MREKLPEGFQRSEFLLEHGAIDMIIPRVEMRPRVAAVLRKLVKAPMQVRPMLRETDEARAEAQPKA